MVVTGLVLSGRPSALKWKPRLLTVGQQQGAYAQPVFPERLHLLENLCD